MTPSYLYSSVTFSETYPSLPFQSVLSSVLVTLLELVFYVALTINICRAEETAPLGEGGDQRRTNDGSVGRIRGSSSVGGKVSGSRIAGPCSEVEPCDI